jgi:predicted enzyme related to lactoylglutathione lyase
VLRDNVRIVETTVNARLRDHSMSGEEIGAITRFDEYASPDGTTIPHEPGSEGGVRLYLDVPDGLTEALSRVESAGGTVLVGKQRVSTGAHFAFVEDSEGNEIGLWEGR